MTETYLLECNILMLPAYTGMGFPVFCFYEDYIQIMLPLLSQQSSCRSLFGPLATKQKFQVLN